MTNSLFADYRDGVTVPDGGGLDTESTSHRATLSAVHAPRISTKRSTVERVLIAGGAWTASIMLVASCDDGGAGSAERFCGEIAENKDALTAPNLQFSDDIEPFLDLYRDIGDLAPLSIQQEWTQLTSAYETASTVVVGDVDSEQIAASAIYSSEAAAAKIDSWLRANCAVEIGPVVTLVPHP